MNSRYSEMNVDNINLLQVEQEKAILDTTERIEKLDQFRDDYIKLQHRLTTLPDSITHDIMVPFGKMAFMPGRLVHTNEILVLLGDNWFVDRSAKQSSEMIDRRLKDIDKQIIDLKKQKDLLRPRLGVTSELQDMLQAKKDVIEINEEYSIEEELKWDEKHRERVKRERLRDKKENEPASEQIKPPKTSNEPPPKTSNEPPPKTSNDDESLWERLEQMEGNETEDGEMEESVSESESESDDSSESEIAEDEAPSELKQKSSKQNRKGVRWKDVVTNESMNATGTSKSTKQRSSMVIRFSHSSGATEINQACDKGEAGINAIQSPSDIYRLFGHVTQPQSILKKSTSAQSIVIDDVKSEKSSLKSREVFTQKTKPVIEAFKNEVMERNTSQPSQNSLFTNRESGDSSPRLQETELVDSCSNVENAMRRWKDLSDSGDGTSLEKDQMGTKSVVTKYSESRKKISKFKAERQANR